MSKALVAFFSASGVTRKVAEELAQVEKADLFEIVPEVLYTKEDLNYMNKESRSTVEMNDLSCRPAVKDTVCCMDQYDVVFLGFPVWWGREPSIVDTFLDAYDLTGKKIIPFCTSGGGGIDGAAQRIAELSKATVEKGARLGGDISLEDLKIWADELAV